MTEEEVDKFLKHIHQLRIKKDHLSLEEDQRDVELALNEATSFMGVIFLAFKHLNNLMTGEEESSDV